jgi:hypothetical protein
MGQKCLKMIQPKKSQEESKEVVDPKLGASIQFKDFPK